MKPGKHQPNEQRCQDYVGRATILHNLLFCAHTLCMSYVTHMFLLVSSYCTLCRVKDKKNEQKHTTKNFVEFHNHSPLLTMSQGAHQLAIDKAWKSLTWIYHANHLIHLAARKGNLTEDYQITTSA